MGADEWNTPCRSCRATISPWRRTYVDKLGFTVRFEATDDGKNGIVGLARGTIELTIDCPMSGHGRDAFIGPIVTEAGPPGRLP